MTLLSCCLPLLACRANLGSIASYLQSTSQQYPGIINSSELLQATASLPDSSTQGCTVAQLAAAAPLLLALVSKAALLLVLSVLSELLMYGRPQQQLQLLQEAGRMLKLHVHDSCCSVMLWPLLLHGCNATLQGRHAEAFLDGEGKQMC